MKGKVRSRAVRIRDLWASLADAVAQRLQMTGIDHTADNEKEVTSVLLLMAARSAARIDIGPEDFARIAKKAYDVSDPKKGPRRTARIWVAKGGIGVSSTTPD